MKFESKFDMKIVFTQSKYVCLYIINMFKILHVYKYVNCFRTFFRVVMFIDSN